MTGAALLPLLVGGPVAVAALLVLVPTRPRLSQAALVLTGLASTGAGVALVVATADGSVLAHAVGGWTSVVAIPFVADMLTALMLTVTGLLTVTCSWFAIASGDAALRPFAPLVLVLTAGVNGALLTGDLFNLFVFVEVMLLPSYGLLLLSPRGGASTRRLGGVRLYVTVNLLTSTVFLLGVALVYGVTGTVNMAELAGAAQESTAVAVAVAVCLLALGIKAAVVPVHGWLARAYPSTSPAVTALFSGLHTKVAIYAIYRIYAVVFEGDDRFLWVGVVLFCATMVVGVLGAVGERSTRSVLAFHMVSQIGYILLGVALFGPLGLTAGIFYLLHHMVVKASLFLSTGAVEVRYGSRPLGRVSGIARTEPLVAVAFFAAALSLAGLPPFSGFVAKLTLVLAALEAGQVAAAVVAVAVSLLTLLSMLKIWAGMFWGDRSAPSLLEEAPAGMRLALARAAGDRREATAVLREQEADLAPRRRIGLGLAGPGVLLALVTLALGVGAQGLLTLAGVAADGLLDTTGYVQAVLGA